MLLRRTRGGWPPVDWWCGAVSSQKLTGGEIKARPFEKTLLLVSIGASDVAQKLVACWGIYICLSAGAYGCLLVPAACLAM